MTSTTSERPRAGADLVPHWPLVVFELPPQLSTGFVGVLDASMKRVFARQMRFVSLVDASKLESLPDANARRALGEWSKTIDAPTRKYQVANALVVPSAMARGVLTAIHWIHPPPMPTIVCATVAEGIQFLRGHARDAGLPLGPLDEYARTRR